MSNFALGFIDEKIMKKGYIVALVIVILALVR